MAQVFKLSRKKACLGRFYMSTGSSQLGLWIVPKGRPAGTGSKKFRHLTCDLVPDIALRNFSISIAILH